MKNFLASVFLGLMATACYDNSDCSSIYSSQLNIGFFNFDSVDSGGVLYPDIPSFITIATEEVILFDSTSDTATVAMGFPINPHSDTTIFYFNISLSDTTEENVRDTLGVVFSRKPILIHPDCGMRQIFDIDTFFSTFDTTSVRQKAIRYPEQNQDLINIEVFY